MARAITITDHRRRDAQVELVSAPKAPSPVWKSSSGTKASSARLIKSPEGHGYDDLLARYGDVEAVGQALIDGDPEIAIDLVGRHVGHTDRVWLARDGSILYSAKVMEVVMSPEGAETERRDFVEVEATVGVEQGALPWSGKLFPIAAVVSRFALVRTLQVRHVNGLTFDFLHEIAKHLEDEGKMLLLGSGTKGSGPLIFNRNGSPYRGFLEGRVDGDGFLLLLHLSNMELKKVTP
jgi:hypothetical protein